MDSGSLGNVLYWSLPYAHCQLGSDRRNRPQLKTRTNIKRILLQTLGRVGSSLAAIAVILSTFQSRSGSTKSLVFEFKLKSFTPFCEKFNQVFEWSN